jgi:hypothetical protein
MDETPIAVAICGTDFGIMFVDVQRPIHRESKPISILLNEYGFAKTGNPGRTRLADLGLARDQGCRLCSFALTCHEYTADPFMRDCVRRW